MKSGGLMPERQHADKRNEGTPARTSQPGSRPSQPKTEEVFDPRRVTAAQVLYLQRAIGNGAAAAMLTGSATRAEIVVQRDPLRWTNVKAEFQTKNDRGQPNSQYQVRTPFGHRRYAPVNIAEHPEQAYFDEDNESFAYLDAESHAAMNESIVYFPQVEDVSGNKVTFSKTLTGKQPEGLRTPEDGKRVFSATVDDKGGMTPPHIGDPVTKLGGALPTLDDEKERKKAKKKYGKKDEGSRCIIS
jgi:hypothetical protein